MDAVARIIVTAFSLLVVAELIPGITVTGLTPALIAAVLLGILNALVRPVLVFLTFPITLLTLGLFIFVINAALFGFVSIYVDGFEVDGFWPALFGSLVVSMVSSFVNRSKK